MIGNDTPPVEDLIQAVIETALAEPPDRGAPGTPDRDGGESDGGNGDSNGGRQAGGAAAESVSSQREGKVKRRAVGALVILNRSGGRRADGQVNLLQNLERLNVPASARANLKRLNVATGNPLPLERLEVPPGALERLEDRIVGSTVNFDVRLEGLAGRCSYVRWSLLNSSSGTNVQERWLNSRDALYYRPPAQDAKTSSQFWVPLLRHRTRFFVRVELFADTAGRLDLVDSKVFRGVAPQRE